jgi:hypothetical protein
VYIKAIESLNDAKIIKFVSHLILDCLPYFLTSFGGTTRYCKVVYLSEDKDKSIVICLFDVYLVFVVAWLWNISFEIQTGFVCTAFETFFFEQDIMYVLVPEARRFRVTLERFLNWNYESSRKMGGLPMQSTHQLRNCSSASM